VGILSSETEDSISCKFEQSFCAWASRCHRPSCSLILQHCHLKQKRTGGIRAEVWARGPSSRRRGRSVAGPRFDVLRRLKHPPTAGATYRGGSESERFHVVFPDVVRGHEQSPAVPKPLHALAAAICSSGWLGPQAYLTPYCNVSPQGSAVSLLSLSQSGGSLNGKREGGKIGPFSQF
jgi:hypothetical protein